MVQHLIAARGFQWVIFVNTSSYLRQEVLFLPKAFGTMHRGRIPVKDAVGHAAKNFCTMKLN